MRFLVLPFSSDFDQGIVSLQNYTVDKGPKTQRKKPSTRCGKGLLGVKRVWEKSERGELKKGILYSVTSPRTTSKLFVHKINPKHIAKAVASASQLVEHHPEHQKAAGLITGQGTRLGC